MIEFFKKDKNGRDITVKITSDTLRVRIVLYAKVIKKFLFWNRTKTEEILYGHKSMDDIAKWSHRDYEKWADDSIFYLNKNALDEEKRARTADKIKRGII